VSDFGSQGGARKSEDTERKASFDSQEKSLQKWKQDFFENTGHIKR
jgi:hypothetical protein